MIPVVVGDEVWRKPVGENRTKFEALNLPCLPCMRLGKQVALSFCQPPANALETPRARARWDSSTSGAAMRRGEAAKPTR